MLSHSHPLKQVCVCVCVCGCVLVSMLCVFPIINGTIQCRVCLKECVQVWWSGCGLYVSHGLREQVYTSESVFMSGNECICVCVSVSELWCAPHQLSLHVWTL